MDGIQRAAERFVKDVADSGAPAQFGGFDVSGGALDGRAVSRGEFRYDLQQRLALIGNVFAVRV